MEKQKKREDSRIGQKLREVSRRHRTEKKKIQEKDVEKEKYKNTNRRVREREGKRK